MMSSCALEVPYWVFSCPCTVYSQTCPTLVPTPPAFNRLHIWWSCCGSCNKIPQAFSFRFCILQVRRCRRPGNKGTSVLLSAWCAGWLSCINNSMCAPALSLSTQFLHYAHLHYANMTAVRHHIQCSFCVHQVVLARAKFVQAHPTM